MTSELTEAQRQLINQKLEEIKEATGEAPALLLFSEGEFAVVLDESLSPEDLVNALASMLTQDPNELPPTQTH